MWLLRPYCWIAVLSCEAKSLVALEMEIARETPPKFNITLEKSRLEAYFPIGKVTFQVLS